MRSHNLDNIPTGYRAVTWSEVQPNQYVYLQAAGEDISVIGPFRVIDPQNYKLRNLALRSVGTCTDEILLVKKGPLVVVTVSNGVFTGVYADVPLEVAVTKIDSVPVARYCEVRRAHSLDALSSEQAQLLDATLPPGWPAMYGHWEVQEVTAATIAAAATTLVIDNTLAGSALAMELMRLRKPFYVETVGSCCHFKLTKATLDYITQHLRELVKDMSHAIV